MLYGFTQLLPEGYLSLYDILEFMIRVVLSGLMGIVIGLERSKRLKEAGIRTHFIIASTAAVFMILSKYCFMDLSEGLGVRTFDASRIASLIVIGVSFLGAGVIFHQGGSIKGLTTAAGMWATAAIGMSIGAGFYWVGIVLTALIVITQLLLHRFPVGNDALHLQTVSVTMDDTADLRQRFEELVSTHGGEIVECDLIRNQGRITMTAVIRTVQLISHETSIAFMDENKGVTRISV